MPAHRCFIIPPYLLSAIADSTENGDDLRQSARQALDHQSNYAGQRKLYLETALDALIDQATDHHYTGGFVPPHILGGVADSPHNSADVRDSARQTLELDAQRDEHQKQLQASANATHSKTSHRLHIKRAVYDAEHSMDQSSLPGELCRKEGQEATEDEAVNEAYDNTGKVLEFYAKLFNWNSYNNKNAKVKSTVHFGEQYENACKFLPSTP